VLVEFNVKNLLGKIPVSPERKLYYEQIIQIIVENLFSSIDISKIEKIIVPDDFIADVLEYQEHNNMANPSVTNNEFGKAYGKVLFDKNKDHYIVFLDPEYATLLMEDSMFNAFFNNLDEETNKIAHVERQRALNLLAHELAHVEFATQAIIPDVTPDYESQLESLLFSLFDEYYACRRSSAIGESIITYSEKYINDIEQKIHDEKWKYKTHVIDLNEFYRLFHDLTKQCLLAMVAVLSSLEGKKTKKPLYESCRIGFLVDDFRTEFDKIYVAFRESNAITMSPSLSEKIHLYFASFGVHISERPEGVYYSIPD
jgi:hypothetical protein